MKEEGDEPVTGLCKNTAEAGQEGGPETQRKRQVREGHSDPSKTLNRLGPGIIPGSL